AFGSIWQNRALRRLEYAWVGSIIGTWAYAIALGVFAYHVGGAAAVGLAGLVRTLPTIVFGPMVSALGDRFPRVRVMVLSGLGRMQHPEERAEEEREEAAAAAEPVATAARGFFAESMQGFSTIFRDGKLRTLVLLFTAQTLVAGALNVFVVVLALRLYHSGPQGVGALNAALGVGGVI